MTPTARDTLSRTARMHRHPNRASLHERQGHERVPHRAFLGRNGGAWPTTPQRQERPVFTPYAPAAEAIRRCFPAGCTCGTPGSLNARLWRRGTLAGERIGSRPVAVQEVALPG